MPKSQEHSSKIKTFKGILREVGIDLSFDEEPHILKREQALVLRDLEVLLENSNICEEFMNGLKIVCKKEKYFKKALSLTVLKTNDNNETLNLRSERIEQESLIR